MSQYEIEKNVPLTERKRGKNTIYPFGDLEVGDSFFVDNKPAKTVVCAASAYKRSHPEIKLVTRKNENGVRVWRVE